MENIEELLEEREGCRPYVEVDLYYNYVAICNCKEGKSCYFGKEEVRTQLGLFRKCSILDYIEGVVED